jgi:multiple sugar transport system substrate-binding protein
MVRMQAAAAQAHRWRLILALASLLVAACAGSAPTVARTGTITPSPAPITITWSFWGDPWEREFNRRLARAFELEHPGIQVRLEHHPWGEYFAWLRGEWRVGRSPDVMFLNYIPSYAASGELEPIDAFVARDRFDLSDFHAALLDGFRAEGRLYGLPRDNDTKVIYYNRAHFAEAALPEPAEGWTWADLRAAALRLARPAGPAPRYGFGFEPEFWWLVWLWQHGGDLVDDPYRPTACLLDTTASIEAIQFLSDLIHRDRVTPPPDQLTTEQMSRLFREGRLSMLFGNHALIPWFTETKGLSWDVAPLPRDRTDANVGGGAGFVISRRSAHKEAAWQLVTYLTGRKAQAILAESGVITPARRSVREDNIFLRQQPYRAEVFLRETQRARPVPNFPGVTAVYQAINEGLAPVWRGERPAEDALHELAAQVRRLAALAP